MSHPPDGAPAPGAPRLTAQSIRSFVLRQGRMSSAQSRACEALLPRYGIDYRADALDYARVFGRQAPVVVEIGFGMGETTVQIAAAMPERDFIGIEVHAPGVGALLKVLEQRAIGNVRVLRHDAVEVMRDMIAPGSLAGVHVFFPDPWPKARHHKRRLLQAPFVALIASRLAPGGILHCATDWQDYAEQMLAVLAAEPLLANTADGYAARPSYRPLTKFEARGIRLGHQVFDLVFRRLPPAAGAQGAGRPLGD
ncbi:MAG: tRNA (guanosine(46)-N7)-methyltransferase TrmB [Burkholderiales bacterium]|nr:tRNA (guanosine(46)-N7)-methyltransferase TrmB [Burkholderiales bacterium]